MGVEREQCVMLPLGQWHPRVRAMDLDLDQAITDMQRIRSDIARLEARAAAKGRQPTTTAGD